VLSVGAADANGEPLASSNWGSRYRAQGIVAPGCVGDLSGTSAAAAVVSAVAALLLSLQQQRGLRPDPLAVRQALRASALGCDAQPAADCRRLLLGRLNISGALDLLFRGNLVMSSLVESVNGDSPAAADVPPPAPEAPTAAVPAVQPSDCGCARCAGVRSHVYALGQLGYDLVSEARLDSLVQKMAETAENAPPDRMIVHDTRRVLDHLERNPWDAAALTWTLKLDDTVTYALRPEGPFAGDTYALLRRFLREQLDEGVERVSVPGVTAGETRLLNGQLVPIIAPELRGMYSWTTKALVAATVGAAPAAEAPAAEREQHERRAAGMREFLDRVYHGLRNLGQLPHDRALNFAATNAFQAEEALQAAAKEDLDLDSINVVHSPICRPGSDCWDVELYFFFPARQVQTVRKVYRFTVDVSDVVPVTVGPMRSWFTR
jgi:cyanobactin maturation PatA/PatG family protease